VTRPAPWTRRLFLNGSLKATILAGVGGRLSIARLLAEAKAAPPARRYDGELVAESYDIAHRLRDGSLAIPPLHPEGPLHDGIVIGGGMSGLMAAWDLRRGGLDDVVLYEKEGSLGGNARKEHGNGTDFTVGTWSCVRPRDQFMKRLLKDLDVIESFAADGTPRIHKELLGPGPDFNQLVDGTWYPELTMYGLDVAADVRRMPLSAKDRDDLIDFYREMQAWGERKGKDGVPVAAMPVEEGSRDPEILELDTITLAEWMKRRGWGERTQRIAADWATSDIGGTPEEVSAYGFWTFNGLGQGGEDITIPGGNAWLAERLAAKAGPDRLRTGLVAVRVANEGPEVRVTLVDPKTLRFSMRRARCAVIACPKHITGRMVPELAAAGRTQYLDFRYGALIMGAAFTRRTPVLKGAPLAWFNSADGKIAQGFLVGDYNSDRWRKADPKRPNVLLLWSPLGGKVTRAELLTEPWSKWADILADDLEMMVPGIMGDITRLDVYVWGHHMVIPTPGFLTGTARRDLTRPLGRVTFAHSDRHGMPSFELATRAGADAAREALVLVRG
jgi:hypothetical protein